MSSVKVTFNIKDEHQNILGCSALVDEFSNEDFYQGILDDVVVENNQLRLAITDFIAKQIGPVEAPANYHSGAYGMEFTIADPVRLRETTLRSNGSGSVMFELWGYESNQSPVEGVKLEEKYFVLSDGFNVIDLDMSVPAGFSYYWIGRTTSSTSLGRASVSFPVTDEELGVTFTTGISSGGATATNWYYIYNLHIEKDAYADGGYRVSDALDLSAFGTTNPELRIRWQAQVSEVTSVVVEAAVTDSSIAPPNEMDWEEQTNGELLTNDLSGDLSSKFLWTRQKLATSSDNLTPFFDWLIIYEDADNPYAAVRVAFDGRIKSVDSSGTVDFEEVNEPTYHVVYNRRYGVTELYDQAIIDCLESIPGVVVDVIDEGQVPGYNYSNVGLLVIGAPNNDYQQHPAAGFISQLATPILSFCRYTSREDLNMASASASSSISSFRVMNDTHPICQQLGLLNLDNVAIGGSNSSQTISSLSGDIDLIMDTGSGGTAGLCERTFDTFSHIHFGYHRFDAAGLEGEELLRQTVKYMTLGAFCNLHALSLASPYGYVPLTLSAVLIGEEDVVVDIEVSTLKVAVTSFGFQVEQGLEASREVTVTSLGFQVEISEPIIIDFEGFGIESREQVSTSDFIILGTTATGISVFPASLTIMPGGLAVLQATVRPPDAADRDVIWSTSDYAVVSVVGDGERGTIRGHVEGIATITAISKDGGYSVTCQVTVAERMPVPYEALKILRPNFSEIVTLDNTEIVDLTITKELSGHYGVEFTLPVGVTGWEEIRRGRYIETEGQKFAIEQIRPVRQSDGIPLLQVTCSHIFFEIERVNMPHDTTARSTIQDHVNYVLRNTGFVTLTTDKENHFYQIDRVIDYSASDSRFTAFQRIFQVFGGHYRLNDFTVEIIPPRPTPPTSAVVLEYAVTNAAIEKHEDDADVITTLYATGGQVDGVPLERVVQAGPEIRALYRKERVRFVNFGDIRVWNNFVYVTDQYLEKRQLPRTTYSLSVAELKRINDIENLYPERDFELDIGKVVQVKDTDLGIDTQKLLQRYTYKPLQPDHLSSVIVGDKPFDIAFTEIGREGVVQEEEGEWRYDEGTREWIFFPANPIIEDDTGEDYTLTITEHPSSCGPAGLRYRYHTGEDRPERSTLTIKEGASASGKVIVILDTEIYSVVIEDGDSPAVVALKIAAADYLGWETEQADNVVVFTAKRVGAKRYSADYRFGLTGAIGGFVTIKCAQEAFTSDWKDAGLPFEQTFNEGDEVQVIARSDSKWYSLVDWTGDGEGFSPRLYIMDSNQSSQVRFASTAGAIDVRTRTPSHVTENSAVLQGEILDPSKFGSVERGFVWAYASNPTLSSNEGQIWVGTGGKGSFSAAFHQPVGDPYDQRYYYQAYAKAYDQECQREMVAYGITRSFTFAYEEYAVEVVVMTIDDIELDAPVNIQPGEGVFSYASGTNVTLDIESASLPEGATFERWLIIDQQTGTFESVTENPYSFEIISNYRIVVVIARPAMVLWVNQEEGTGVIQIADGPDGPRTAWRLGFAMRFDRTVYVWTVPDDESQQGKWTEDSGGVGEEPRVFALGETFVEYRATVRWSPLHVCEKRCIFISPDDPDPTVGVDGNIWLKYRE